MTFLPAKYICVTYIWEPWSTEESDRFPGTGVIKVGQSARATGTTEPPLKAET